jgi:hypothetical protein
MFGAKRANHGNYQVKVIIYCIRPLVGILQQPLFFITTLKQGLRRVTLTNQEKRLSWISTLFVSQEPRVMDTDFFFNS